MNYIFIFLIFIFIFIGLLYFFYYNIFKDILKIYIENSYKLISIFLSILLIILFIVSLKLRSILFVIVSYFTALSFIIFIISKTFNKKINNKKVISYLYLFSLLISIIYTGYGYYNINKFKRSEYTFYTSKDIKKDLKILFLSDSHYGDVFKKDKLDELMKKINKEKNIDIVILGGDIVEESTTKDQMEEIFFSLSKIKSKYGIFYVYGNHDKQIYLKKKKYEEKDLTDTLKKNNIKLLNDSYMNLDDNLYIIGRNDISYGRIDLKEYISDKENIEYKILVDHQPKDYDEANSLGVDLILSGHTHAGQLFPGLEFIKLINTADLVYGHKKIGNMDAVVSSGVYGWGFPIRTSKHSEYIVINIKKNSNK